MPDPKKNSSIFSFSKGQINLLAFACIFFTPVIVGFLLVESLVVDLPSNFKTIGERLDEKESEVETLIFGSSQIMRGINPQYLDSEALNLSSGSQHHNTDFRLLKGLEDRLNNLKTVVFEVSFGHLELPHNSENFWKNAAYLKYYDVNTYGRSVTFKDKILFTSQPAHYSDQLIAYYLKDSLPYSYNQYGFDTAFLEGKFFRLNYDHERINNSRFGINNRENLEIFKQNTAYLDKMLAFASNNEFNVVVISPPTFNNYNKKRNPNIVRRRDSILRQLSLKYPRIKFLNCENDLSFAVKDFYNENHLNPQGAQKFSSKLDSIIKAF